MGASKIGQTGTMTQPEPSCHLQEVHFCSLPSQSNVYGLAKIKLPGDQYKILVASLRGKVVSLEFQNMRPLSREVHFTYIPGDAEIVSIDAFTKPGHGKGVVVGISFIKIGVGEKPSQFLNIYCEWDSEEVDSEINLESIAQGCHQNLELNFTPYQLCHAEILQGNTKEKVFLLSGNDQKIHLYREEKYTHVFGEEPIETHFPELTDLKCDVTWIDCKMQDELRRITATGCLDGTVTVALVNTRKKEILSQWTTQHDSPITTVKLFTHATNVDMPTFLPQDIYSGEEIPDYEPPEHHLVVASSTEMTLVYRDVAEKGLSEPLILQDSNRYDCVLCVQIADIDFDGHNEILLGTYGQEMLVYKYHPRHTQDKSKGSHLSDTNLSSPEKAGASSGDYKMFWQRSFADPLLALEVIDITGDGVREILALSLKGLHVLQHNLEEMAALCKTRLEQAVHQGPQEDVFQQLLSENL